MGVSSWSNFRNGISPRKEARRIAVIYGVVGITWILLSDKVLSSVITNDEIYKQMQTIKGWFYVIATVAMVYVLVYNRLRLLKITSDKVLSAYDEISAVEEELRVQYEELESHRDALVISDQRYKLIVDGANDGIWDWDIFKNVYYFSAKWKKNFGYTDEDLENSFDTWKSLLHEDDRESSLKTVDQYLKSKDGIYQQNYRLRRKDGAYRWVLSRGIAIWDENGNAIRMAGSHTDITEIKDLENKLEIMAFCDELTGLPNRFSFESKMQSIIDHMEIGEKFALIYIDVDNFKHINDTLGHSSGDLLLKYLASILKYQIKGPDFVARISGDEFAIVFLNVKSKEGIIEKLNELNKYLQRPWKLGVQEFYISFSMGIALYPEHGNDLLTLLKNADTAMFCVKDMGKDDHCFYTPGMNEKAVKYAQIVNQLRSAIKNEEFVLYYQPQINVKTGKMEGMEALIRWIHPEMGFVSPGEFIPIAEESGLIKNIDMWVLRTVCEQQRKWKEEGYDILNVSLNLSGRSITNLSLPQDIKTTIHAYDIECCDIGIEITETAIMSDVDIAMEVLHQIKNLGIKISLDDFGTGYSSLNYLQKLPIDTVKMDRGFLNQITEVHRDRVIVQSIIQLSHNLNLKVVAEGVEAAEQVELLKELECNIIQGYYYSRPIPAEQIQTSLLKK